MPFGLPKYGNGIGFRRLLAFCDAEQIDLDTIGRRSVVITGSNGKGSTARFLYQALQPSIERVGCFISPHLWKLEERFEISGERIDRAALEAYAGRILAFNHEDSLGAYELLFLIALLWFRDRNVQSAVWEAGIGGRYDPVRVLRSPLSTLTSVDLEHTEILGATRQLIAFDKLDATRPFGRTFISPAVDAALTPDLEAFARITDRLLTFVSRGAGIDQVTREAGGMHYTMALPGRRDRIEVTTPLLGISQVYNSATALHVAAACTSLNVPAAVEAIARTIWPGRLERIQEHPEIWIDVGHTPEAITVTSEALRSMFDPAKLLVVFGVSANKAVAEIASIIRRNFPNVILTQAYKMGFDAKRLATEHFDGAPSTTRIEEAADLAQTIASARGWTIAVLGGLFLAIEFGEAVRGRDPRDLDFF